jgi:solute carrier family 26 (sodium-independent sulfate anion transporter), member 11
MYIQDRPWNDAGPRHLKADEHDPRPTLKAIVLDFATVNHIDATSIQTLLDTRNQLDRFTAPETVDWHFANVTSRWTKRGLVAAGFGVRGRRGDDAADGTRATIFSIAELAGAVESKPAPPRAPVTDEETPVPARSEDVIAHEKGGDYDSSSVATAKKGLLLQGINRPLFHFDLQEAVEAAIADAKTKTF